MFVRVMHYLIKYGCARPHRLGDPNCDPTCAHDSKRVQHSWRKQQALTLSAGCPNATPLLATTSQTVSGWRRPCALGRLRPHELHLHDHQRLGRLEVLDVRADGAASGARASERLWRGALGLGDGRDERIEPLEEGIEVVPGLKGPCGRARHGSVWRAVQWREEGRRTEATAVKKRISGTRSGGMALMVVRKVAATPPDRSAGEIGMGPPRWSPVTAAAL